MKKGRNKMPDVIVANKKMSWKEYEKMIKEMEKTQKPFKDFIEKEVMPSYKKIFEEKSDLSEEIKKRHILVAEKFFERVLWVGFVSYERIRPEFAKHEFPRWWQTHVLLSNLDENQVWSALRRLIDFVRNNYGLEMVGETKFKN